MRFVTFFFYIMLCAGCSTPVKIVNYEKLGDDGFSNDNLKLFFKDNPFPKIVLRIPNNENRSEGAYSTGGNSLYNTIEKELLKAGFVVRDRSLFSEIMNNVRNTDYSKLKEITDTDLILEVLNIDPAVVYNTNMVRGHIEKSK